MGQAVIGKSLASLGTPAFCVDLDIVEKNCQKMLGISQKLGVKLRPQMKTHKTMEAAVLMTGGTKRCIVISTLAEAEFFASGGFDDILYAYPLTPDKFDRCKGLFEKLEAFHILTDNLVVIEELQEYLHSNKTSKIWSIFLKVDCGYGRAGVWWEDATGVDIAKRIVNCDGMKFAGVYVHCGNSYHAVANGSSVANVENESIQRLTSFVERLKLENIPCETVGIGSTPSCSQPVPQISSLTEIHPGNYVFYDAMQMGLGSCEVNEIACTVATRVIGHYPKRNEILVDCGFTALTKQGQNLLPGGFVIFKDHSELKLKEMTQEVGKVSSVDGTPLDFSRYPIGKTLFMFPYHACATAAMYPFYYMHRNDTVVDIWKPCRGW